MENKNITINVLKGAAITLVVYGHVLQRSMVLAGEDFFNHPVFKVIYTFHMPLFVFISGYLVALSLGRKNYFGVFKSRCKSLLLPFVIWGILGIFVFYALDFVDGKEVRINLLGDVFDQLLVHPAVWFLSTLLILSGYLILSLKLQKHLGFFAFAAVYFLILLIPFNEFGGLYYIKWFYVFYAAGYLTHQYGAALIAQFAKPGAFAVFLLAFIALASLWSKNDFIYVNKMNFLMTDFGREILRYGYRYIVGFLGIVISFFIGSYLAKSKISKSLELLGLFSLDIYLLQRYLVEGLFPRLLVRLGIRFDAYSPIFLIIVAPAIVILAVLLCLVTSKMLIRKFPLLNKLLLGHRLALV